MSDLEVPRWRRLLCRADRAFIGLGAIGTLTFLLLHPPFQVPDEPAHFFRAYQISEGQLRVARAGRKAGGMIPQSVLQTKNDWSQKVPFDPEARLDLARALRTFALPLAPEVRRFKDFRNAAPFSPVPYAPQALAIFLGRLFDAAPIVLFFLARAANALVAFLLCLWSIRLLPFGHWSYMLMLLTPIFCAQRSSVSPDALTNSLAFLNFASALAVSFSAGPSRRGSGGAYVASAILLCLSKYAYSLVPFALLVGLANPAARHRIPRLLIGAYVPGLLLTGAWALVAAGTIVPISSGSDPVAQLAGILRHPVAFGALVLEHLAGSWQGFYAGLIGVLGWLDTPLPRWFVHLYWVTLLAVTVPYSKRPHLSLTQRSLLFACAAASYLLVVSFLYLAMEVGAPLLRGIQSRHLIPLLPLLLFSASGIVRVRAKLELAPVLCWSVGTISTLVAVETLLSRYHLG